jgi:hypothetical protein
VQFLFGQAPYSHRKTNKRGEIFADVRAGIPPAVRPDEIAPDIATLWDLLELCWLVKPEMRIGSSHLLDLLQDLEAGSNEANQLNTDTNVITKNIQWFIGSLLPAEGQYYFRTSHTADAS